MKRALTLSIIVNLILAGWIFRLSQARPAAQPSAPVNTPTAERADSSRQTQPPFRWSQIESSDYRQYIANLKSIGCPRQTIVDIITADVHGLFNARRDQLNRGQMEASLRRAKVEAMDGEERSVLQALLGMPSDSPAAGGNVSLTRSGHAPEDNGSFSIPLVFRSNDFPGLNLTEDQLQSLAYLRDAFRSELSESNLDRSSPDYLKEWRSAQAQNDLMLHGMLGTKLYEQMQAQNRATAGSPR